MQEPTRIKMHTLSRWAEPLDDDALGQRLVEVLRSAVTRGGAPAAAMGVRAERIDLVVLDQVRSAGMPLMPFVAGLSRSEIPGTGDVQAVGLIGTFFLRRSPDEPGVPLALVFLEWPDCRWWCWRALVEPEGGELRAGTETLARAVDGDPRPDGLGGWWSLGRRGRMQVRLVPDEPIVVH